jgi:hypothetical protein
MKCEHNWQQTRCRTCGTDHVVCSECGDKDNGVIARAEIQARLNLLQEILGPVIAKKKRKNSPR